MNEKYGWKLQEIILVAMLCIVFGVVYLAGVYLASFLSTLLTRISEKGGSVLTINQNMPIHGKASVTIGLDVSEMNAGTDELVEAVASVPGVDNARLVAIE